MSVKVFVDVDLLERLVECAEEPFNYGDRIIDDQTANDLRQQITNARKAR